MTYKIKTFNDLGALLDRRRYKNLPKILNNVFSAEWVEPLSKIGIIAGYERDIIATLDHKNILTFTDAKHILRWHESSLLSSGHRVFPVSFNRASNGVMMAAYCPDRSISHKCSTFTNMTLAGSKLDILTGRWENATMYDMENPDPEARRQWLRALKEFKRGFKVRAKLGAFDRAINSLPPRYPRDYVDVANYPEFIYECMRTGTYPDKLVHITINERTDRYNIPCTESLPYYLDELIKKNSVALRIKYGVFKEVTYDMSSM